MAEPITPEQRLAEIRERDDRALKRAEDPACSLNQAEYDRTLVLDEVDRLNAELGIAFGPSLYLAVQQVLDKALGTDGEDGAGAGIVGDITLVAERMQAAEAEVDRLRAGIVALDRLDRVAIGDWEREVDRLKAENKQLRLDAEREEQATGNLIDERDDFHALLDRFAAAVAPIEVIGEHSSGNDPWVNALDMVTPAVEVDRFKSVAYTQASMISELTSACMAAELERDTRLTATDVERFLKRERDEYEPGGECWNTVDDVLDWFRLYMVTGTPLTEPRPVEGPSDSSVGSPPLTEAEELRAEVDRVNTLVRLATDRYNELGQLRDAVHQEGDTAREERLSFAMQEIRDLFTKARESGDPRD